MALKSKGKLDFNYDHNKCSVSRTNTDDQLKNPISYGIMTAFTFQ